MLQNFKKALITLCNKKSTFITLKRARQCNTIQHTPITKMCIPSTRKYYQGVPGMGVLDTGLD